MTVDTLHLTLACIAIAALVAWWMERDRRRAAERSGPYRRAARHKPSDTAERRARENVRKEETLRVKDLADHLATEARKAGIRASRKDLEAEARRMLLQAGTR